MAVLGWLHTKVHYVGEGHTAFASSSGGVALTPSPAARG